MNIQQQEFLLTANCLHCSNQMKKLFENTTIFDNTSLKKRAKIYDINFKSVAKELNPLFENDNTLNEFVNDLAIKNNRGNYYAYFRNVLKFLNESNSTTVNSLNESLKPLFEINKTSTIDINSLKSDLKNIIQTLDKKDDTFDLPNEILKHKKLLKRPIIVHGVDVVKFDILFDEICQILNISKNDYQNNLVGVAYNKIEKQLYLVPKILSNTICYDLIADELNFYNQMQFETKLSKIEVKPLSFVKILCEQTESNAIIDLYVNIKLQDLKFTDNLYTDVKIQNQVEKLLKEQQQKNLFVKR